MPRVVIVAEHASARFGGKAALPLHYFRLLMARRCEAWLVCHARVQDELAAAFPQHADRIVYTADTWLHRLLWRAGQWLPARISYFTTGFKMRLLAQRDQRSVVRQLVRQHRIDIVHQPMPVSPKEPSIMCGVGAPVIIGPMNGGKRYPPAFRSGKAAIQESLANGARWFSDGLHYFLPGKRQAALLMVANDRTRHALPRTATGRVELLPENGVNLTLWARPLPVDKATVDPNAMVRFVFMGRLVDWKAVDLLLEAFSRMKLRSTATLTTIGDGPERQALRKLSTALKLDTLAPGAAACVLFEGWLTQAECAATLHRQDVLVLPSLWECGGAVVLEAMAAELPVLATAWGGPLDYGTEECGILVPPSSREALVEGLAAGLDTLAGSRSLRERMGAAGRERVLRHFDWVRKMDRMFSHYDQVRARRSHA